MELWRIPELTFTTFADVDRVNGEQNADGGETVSQAGTP